MSMRIRIFALVIFCTVTCLSASASLQQPAVQVEYHNQRFSQTTDSIREVNFQDIAIELFGRPTRRGKGYFHREASSSRGIFEATLQKTIYFRPGNNEPERALLIFSLFYAGGSSTDLGGIYIFALHDNHPVLIQELSYDRQAEGTGEIFNPRDLSLTIRARAQDGSAHCCPEHLDIERFQWNGWRFRLAGRKVIALPKH
jgi:hypothetical protein